MASGKPQHDPRAIDAGAQERLRSISSTEAARNFLELLNRVKTRGESFVIEHAGEAVCELRPTGPTGSSISDRLARLGSAPIDDEYLAVVEELIRSRSARSDVDGKS